jgi:hypothetical protein
MCIPNLLLDISVRIPEFLGWKCVGVSPAEEAATTNTDYTEAVALRHGVARCACAGWARIGCGTCIHGPHAAAPALILRRRIVIMCCGT